MVESHKKKEKPLSWQDKLLVDEWQKRMVRKEKDRKEKDRRAQEDWDEAWAAYVIDKMQERDREEETQENERRDRGS